jgi:uncharacterized protein (TIGR02147 family)
MQPNLYEFNDFRSYLEAWWKCEKARRGKFPKAEVSRLLGLPNTRNYFIDVLGGRRVTDTFVERLVALLALSRDEAKFFRALVAFQQAETADERDAAFDRLVSLNKSPRTQLAPAQYGYFRHWWHAAVRALLDTGDWKHEPERIAATLVPSITPGQARESLKLLSELDLIAPDAKGFLRPTHQAVASPDGTRDELFLQQQLQQLELVKQAMLRPDGPRRLVVTNLLSVSQEGLRHLFEHMDKARSEVRSIAHKDQLPAERVCQVVLAVVPLNEERTSR